MKKLFGTDGIRGIANREPITAETAFQIGRAGAYLFKEKEDSKILIGRDTRISGDMLESALIAGICSLGVNVLKAGIVPTPAVAYLNKIYDADCGIVISASHNSYDNNGIKYIGKNGFKFSDSEEEAIEKIYFENHTKNNRPTGKNIGCIKNLPEAKDKYIKHIKATITPFLNIKGYKVVIDCANGALYKIAPQIFHDLGANVISINDEPNGININLDCGATNTSSLQKEVLKYNAELGLAFDGDADRLIAVDEKGNIVDGDQIMAICALNLIKNKQLTNNLVITTIMSNMGFDKAIEAAGGKVIRTNIGDRYVFEKMKETNAILGGEQSGHIIFLQHGTTGDGLMSSLQLLKVIKEEGKTLSDLASVVTKYPQILLNFKTKNQKSFFENVNISKIIKGSKEELDGNGRIFIRASGTEPLIRVLLEGEDKNKLEKISQNLKEVIEKENI